MRSQNMLGNTLGKWILRLVAAIAVTAFLPMATTGCFGKFQLTKKVYRYNKRVDPDQWVQWFVFIIMNVVPIYGIAIWIDALFANSVEFWTGTNPITASAAPRVTYGPHGEVAVARLVGSGVVDLTITEADGRVHALRLVAEGDSVSALDADGELIARVRDVNGRPVLVPAN